MVRLVIVKLLYSYLHWIRAQEIAYFFISIAEHQRGCQFKGVFLSQNSPCSAIQRLLNLGAPPSATSAAFISTLLLATRGFKESTFAWMLQLMGDNSGRQRHRGRRKNRQKTEDWAVGRTPLLGHPTGQSAAGPPQSPITPSSPKDRGVASGPREVSHSGMLGGEISCITQGKTTKCKHQIYFLGSFCRWLYKPECPLQSVTLWIKMGYQRQGLSPKYSCLFFKKEITNPILAYLLDRLSITT